ncbi:GNAT family N-acetyltransferase [Serratia fonticola]|uniref:GNAT family N-acetyltransferase n=1 Tax=Serratia fonticola TaxID=47917 RepID=UPI003AADB215
MNITYRWTERLSDLCCKDWERCYGSENVLTSYALQRALERSKLADSFHYLSLYCDGHLVAIISCFTQRYSLTDLATPWLQDGIKTIRKLYPDLLRPRFFIVGSPIATCTHMLGITMAQNQSGYPVLIQAMEREINRKASEMKAKFTCIKEIDGSMRERLKPAWLNEFIVCRSPDTTYVYTAPVAGLSYTDNMLSRYRVAFKKRKREFAEAGLRWIIADDFGPYVDKLHHLYLNVLGRSQTKFERLTPEFFQAVNQELNKQSYVLLCLDGERIVAFELMLRGRQLHPLYLGMDYRYRDIGALYFNCLYRIIEESQRQDLRLVELGQTSYEAKFSIGAVSSPLYFYIKHANPLCNWLLRRLRRHIFPEPQIPALRKVFKRGDDYIKALKSEGVGHVDW